MTVDEEGITHNKKHPAVGAEMTKKILRRLKFDNDTTEKVVKLVLYHDQDIGATQAGVRRAMNRIGEDIFPMLFAVHRADISAQSDYMREEKLRKFSYIEELYDTVRSQGDAVSLKDLAITGRDLIAQGMKPGREIGAVLQSLLEQVLEDPSLNTPEQLLEISKKIVT